MSKRRKSSRSHEETGKKEKRKTSRRNLKKVEDVSGKERKSTAL